MRRMVPVETERKHKAHEIGEGIICRIWKTFACQGKREKRGVTDASGDLSLGLKSVNKYRMQGEEAGSKEEWKETRSL